MADEVSTRVRSVVEKLLEADVTDQIARRGREIAAAVTEATEAVSARAGEAWRESEPQRREAEKAARRATKDASTWSRRTWKKNVSPTLRDLWKRRTVAIGAAGAAIPAGRELVEDAAVKLGIRKQREGRHWIAFFLGLLLGAAAGAIVAMLSTPKPGREMRDELAEKARGAAERARDEAGEWVPLFQREAGNGSAEAAVESVAEPAEAAAEAGIEALESSEPVDATPEGEEQV
ncbi:MAG TPA: YtxH domain-containing protein [Candidatus Limnocylindria bacterium]